MKKSVVLSAALAATLLASVALAENVEARAPIYRVYNPHTGEHHYTPGKGEYDYLDYIGWNGEGIAWYAPDAGQPVLRLYNPHNGDHHYTVSKGEHDYLVKVGWKSEGTNGYSGGHVPVYRLYNPNARGAGSHHYTTSKHERDFLINVGWKNEGTGWYVEADRNGHSGNNSSDNNNNNNNPGNQTDKSIAKSGKFTFTARVGIKSEAKLSAKDVAFYDKGQSVNYDRTVEADGYLWISYVASSGTRRYIPVQKLTTPSSSSAATPSSSSATASSSTTPSSTSNSAALPAKGSYTLTERGSIKGSPSVNAAEVAFYNAGTKVNYDQVVQAEGYVWISYVGGSGNRRYIAVRKADASMTPSSTTASNTAPSSSVTTPAASTVSFPLQANADEFGAVPTNLIGRVFKGTLTNGQTVAMEFKQDKLVITNYSNGVSNSVYIQGIQYLGNNAYRIHSNPTQYNKALAPGVNFDPNKAFGYGFLVDNTANIGRLTMVYWQEASVAALNYTAPKTIQASVSVVLNP